MQLWQDLIGPWFQLHVHAACLQVRMSGSVQVKLACAMPVTCTYFPISQHAMSSIDMGCSALQSEALDITHSDKGSTWQCIRSCHIYA